MKTASRISKRPIGTKPSTLGATCMRSIGPRRCTSPGQSPAARRPSGSPTSANSWRWISSSAGPGLYRDLDREIRRLPEHTREQLDWYCQGVNDGLVDAGRTLPMWVTGFRPRPWEPVSVLLIGKLLELRRAHDRASKKTNGCCWS